MLTFFKNSKSDERTNSVKLQKEEALRIKTKLKIINSCELA